MRLAVVALALAVWALPHATRACSCMMLPAPAVAVERADAVFEARVESVSPEGGSGEGVGLLRYDLEVLRVWKGELGAAAQVTSPASGAACGRSLIVGKVYLVYAGRNEGGDLSDNNCSRTRLASTADEDLALLGPGSPPLVGPPATAPTSREPPRIAPPAPDLGPAPIARNGCALDGDGGTSGPLALVVLALARGARRRGRR